MSCKVVRIFYLYNNTFLIIYYYYCLCSSLPTLKPYTRMSSLRCNKTADHKMSKWVILSKNNKRDKTDKITEKQEREKKDNTNV